MGLSGSENSDMVQWVKALATQACGEPEFDPWDLHKSGRELELLHLHILAVALVIHTEIIKRNKWVSGGYSCLQESSTLWCHSRERNTLGAAAYPVSSPCQSTQGSIDRNHRWGCRFRCWHRNRAGHSPARSALRHTLWAQGSLAQDFLPRL